VAKKTKVVHRKLGRHRAYGLAWQKPNLIEIDTRIMGKKLLETLVHESYHIVNPTAEEEEVIKKSIVITNILWEQGFRKVDNDNSTAMQDGSF
jgi:hypothetical protein